MSALAWDDLRYVLAIAEGGSLTAAAQLLGVRHSTVLRRLDALEAQLGARLFERHRQGYAATEAGEWAAAQAREIRAGVDEVERRIVGRDLQLSGVLRLSTAFVAMLYLLPEPLAAFRRQHPGIEVEVSENSELVDMSRRTADVALRMAREVPQHLVGRQLGRMTMRVYAQRGAAHLPQSIQPIERLCRDYPWFAFDKDSRSRFYDRWMHENILPQQVVMRIDLLHPVVAMARTGLALALLPTFIEATEPDLVPVSEPLREVSTPVWMLTHPDLRQTARVRAFLQEVGVAISARLAAAPGGE
ncbi:LysR family transcriptional regulator [Roseateles sp.]|uniref:LysR family transcriptional regulator n=1 Tax=Roseateles sp. TaxID=1971397 RepID=UPI003929F59E